MRTRDYFGYADGSDEKRYLGLVFGDPPRNIVIDDSSMLVRPEVAEKQIADEASSLLGGNDKNGNIEDDGGQIPPPASSPTDLTPKVIPRIMRVHAVGGRSPESGNPTNCAVGPGCSLSAILPPWSLPPAGH